MQGLLDEHRCYARRGTPGVSKQVSLRFAVPPPSSLLPKHTDDTFNVVAETCSCEKHIKAYTRRNCKTSTHHTSAALSLGLMDGDRTLI